MKQNDFNCCYFKEFQSVLKKIYYANYLVRINSYFKEITNIIIIKEYIILRIDLSLENFKLN